MRTNSKHIGIILLAAFALSGCQKERNTAPGGETAQLTLAEPGIVISPENGEDTKAALANYGSFYADMRGQQPADYKMGFCIMKTGSSPLAEHAEGYRNIFARLIKPVGQSYFIEWQIYLNDGLAAPNRRIPLYKNQGNVDFYSYHPYNPDITDINAIPFDITVMDGIRSAMIDYLYCAIPNINPLDANPANLIKYPVYNHVMSLINFQMKVENNITGRLFLNKILVETADGGSWLPIKGTFDATNGNVTPTQFTNSLEFFHHFEFYRSVDLSENGSWMNANVLLPPIHVASTDTNRKLKFTIYLNQDEPAPLESGFFIIDLAQLKNSSSGTLFGLRAGYNYQSAVYIDPSLRFINFDYPIVRPWSGEVINIKI